MGFVFEQIRDDVDLSRLHTRQCVLSDHLYTLQTLQNRRPLLKDFPQSLRKV